MAFTKLLPLVSLLLLVFKAIVIHGHGCSFFRLTDQISRNTFLESEFVPQPVKDFVTSMNPAKIPFGVYDCHEGNGDYEVGYSAACIDDGTCMCTALYNFMECRSCSLSCGADIMKLDINSFEADCSNVKTDISESCTVGCNYTTYSCFADDPNKSTNSSSTTLLSSLSLLLASALAVAFFHMI